MSLSDEVNERDDALVWAHNIELEQRQVRRSIVRAHPDLFQLFQKCLNVYWELFGSKVVSACCVFGAIQLLERFCQTCASLYKFQRVGAACLWIVMKVTMGQDMPLCARALALHWNNVVNDQAVIGERPHFRVQWGKLVKTERAVLEKLQYDVLTLTAHDMFVLLTRIHQKQHDSALFTRGVQILITMSMCKDEIPYLPSEVAAVVALTSGLEVDPKYMSPKWQEASVWIQRFVD